MFYVDKVTKAEYDDIVRTYSDDPTPPHCDAKVLHAPGTCAFCDAHPDWQQLRIAIGINFTGEHDPDKQPCPSTNTRTVERVHAWGGNRPVGVI